MAAPDTDAAHLAQLISSTPATASTVADGGGSGRATGQATGGARGQATGGARGACFYKVNAALTNCHRVRSGPGTSFAVVGTLVGGSRIQVLEEQGDWLRCVHGGRQDVWSMQRGQSAPYLVPEDEPLHPDSTKHPWFAAGVSRTQAEKILSMTRMVDGAFLVRKRLNPDSQGHAFSVRLGGEVRHFPVEQHDADQRDPATAASATPASPPSSTAPASATDLQGLVDMFMAPHPGPHTLEQMRAAAAQLEKSLTNMTRRGQQRQQHTLRGEITALQVKMQAAACGLRFIPFQDVVLGPQDPNLGAAPTTAVSVADADGNVVPASQNPAKDKNAVLAAFFDSVLGGQHKRSKSSSPPTAGSRRATAKTQQTQQPHRPQQHGAGNPWPDPAEHAPAGGNPIDEPGPRGATALIMLATQGKTAELRRVVEVHSADVNAQGYAFNDDLVRSQKPTLTTPLMAAIEHQQSHGDGIKTAQALLEMGADPDVTIGQTSGSQKTALTCATARSNCELAALLLRHNAGVDVHAPLCDAARLGNCDMLTLLLRHNADVNARRSNGQSPLYLACSAGRRAIAWELIKRGADVEAAETSYGYTPLMIACLNNRQDAARLLSICGANVDATCRTRKLTPLYYASQRGSMEMVEMLAERGASVNAASVHVSKTSHQHNQTPLMIAAQRGRHLIVQYLIDRGADVTQRQGDGQTLLYMSIVSGSQATFDAIITLPQAVADVNTPVFSTTPLYAAAQYNRVQFVATLLDQGANVNAGMLASPRTKKKAKPPIQIAAEYGCSAVVDELIKRNADLGIASIIRELLHLPADFEAAKTSLRSYEHASAKTEYCGGAMPASRGDTRHENSAFNSFEYWRAPELDVDVDLDALGPCAREQGHAPAPQAAPQPRKRCEKIGSETARAVLAQIEAHAGVKGHVSRNRKQCHQCGQRFPSRNALFGHLRSARHEILTASTPLLRDMLAGNCKLYQNWDQGLTQPQLELALVAAALQRVILAGQTPPVGDGAALHADMIMAQLMHRGANPTGDYFSANANKTLHAFWEVAAAPPAAESEDAVANHDPAPGPRCPESLVDLARRSSTASLTTLFAGLSRQAHVAVVVGDLLHNSGSGRKFLDVARFDSIMDALKQGGQDTGDLLQVMRASGFVPYMVAVQDSTNAGAGREQCVRFLTKHAPGDMAACAMCNEPHTDAPPVLTGTTSSKFQAACRHKACRLCAARWIGSCTQAGHVAVRCPEPGCTYTMLRSDVGRIAGADARSKLQENQDADFRGRTLAKHAAEVDSEVEAAMFGSDYVQGCAQMQLSKKDGARKAALNVLQDYHQERVATCAICDECYEAHAPVESIIQVRHDRFTKQVCNHHFCAGCIGTWVNTVLAQRSAFIRCPDPACQVTLYADDVERIAGPEAKGKFVALKAADYRGRLLEALTQGLGFEEEKASRPCPACRVVIYRFAGCDDFLCSCGKNFNFRAAVWPTLDELREEIAAINAAKATTAGGTEAATR